MTVSRAAYPVAGGANWADRVALIAALGLFLTYSQFWVFAILGEAGDPASNSLVRLLYLPAYGAAAIMFLLGPGATLKALSRQPFLLLLLAMVAISTFWSIAPAETFRRTVAIYFTTLGGIMLGARYRWTQLSQILAGSFAAVAVMSFLVAVFLPSFGVMSTLFPGAWRGMWPEKNALGSIMSLGFVVIAAAAVLNPRQAKWWWPLAGVALLVLIMSTSKTSLVAMLLGLGGLIFVAMARRNPAAGVATTWMAILGILMFAGVALFAADLFFEVLGKDATLTGRSKIWEAALRQIEQRPWTGYGYGVVWDQKGAWGPLAWIIKQSGFTPQHAHNAWIEQWLGMGVVGLAAFGLFFLQAIVLAILAVYRDPGAYLAVPVVIVYTLMTLTESVAVTYHDFRWVLFVAIATKLALPDPPESERQDWA